MNTFFAILMLLSVFAVSFGHYILKSISQEEFNEWGYFLPTLICLTACLLLVPALFGYENTQVGSFYEGGKYNECYYVIVYDEYSEHKEIMSAQICRYDGEYDIQYLYHPTDGHVPFLKDSESINIEYPTTVTDDFYRDFEIKLTDKKSEKPKHWKEATIKENINITRKIENIIYKIISFVYGIYIIYIYIRMLAALIDRIKYSHRY